VLGLLGALLTVVGPPVGDADSDAVDWVRFVADARREVRRVELPAWMTHYGAAVETGPGAIRAGYVDGHAERHLSLRVTGLPDASRMELRVQGVAVARLAGVTEVVPQLWVTPAGAALGVRLSLRTAGGRERRVHLRFGTPGGTL
jgi:hypothetical protein